MATALLTLLLALLPAPRPQDPAPTPPAPAPEVVEAAVEGLEKAFAKGEAGERVRAIEAAAEVADAKVVDLLARGLDDKELEVRSAALEALRFQEHPSAVDALNKCLRKKGHQKIDDKELAALILAVGQHGSATSLGLLSGGALDRTREHSTRARIQALGHVRDPRSVEELIALMNKAGGGRGGAGSLFDRDFRLSLWALTGTDEGGARESWMRWWNDNKHTLELPDEPAETPRALAVQWRAMWATPRERQRERHKDGNGPGRGRRGGS